MNLIIRAKLAMFTALRDHLRAFPFLMPAEVAVQGRLEDRLGKAETLVTQQHSGVAVFRGGAARRAQVRRDMRAYALPLLARLAEAASQDVPELARLFKLPNFNANSQVFRTVARSMVEQAQGRRDLFLRYGMPETLLDDLGKALGEYDRASGDTNAGRRAHVGASADLDAVVDELMQIVQQLDAMNRYRFQKDPERLAAWESARNIAWPAGSPGDEPPGEASKA